MADDPLNAHGLVRGLLVLALLWWSWVGYAWLANVVQAEEGLGRVAMFGAMAAMFVLALSIPEAFNDLRRRARRARSSSRSPTSPCGCSISSCSSCCRATTPASDDRCGGSPRRSIGSTAVLLVASQLEGRAQTFTWIAALVVDYFGTILGGASGWRLRSASHFAERHGLILNRRPRRARRRTRCRRGAGGDLVADHRCLGPRADGRGLSGGVGVLRRRVDRGRAHAPPGAGRGAGEAGSRRLQLSPHADGRRRCPRRAGEKKVLESVGASGDHELSDPLPLLPLIGLYGGVRSTCSRIRRSSTNLAQ